MSLICFLTCQRLTLNVLDHPLAKGFLLTDGHVRIEVPDVNPGDNYIVVCK